MNVIKLDLEKLSENEARGKLREFGFELPAGFDFKQHVFLSFDVNLKRVVEVEKKTVPVLSSYDEIRSQKRQSQDK